MDPNPFTAWPRSSKRFTTTAGDGPCSTRLRMASICAQQPIRVTASNHLSDALGEPRPRSASGGERTKPKWPATSGFRRRATVANRGREWRKWAGKQALPVGAQLAQCGLWPRRKPERRGDCSKAASPLLCANCGHSLKGWRMVKSTVSAPVELRIGRDLACRLKRLTASAFQDGCCRNRIRCQAGAPACGPKLPRYKLGKAFPFRPRERPVGEPTGKAGDNK